MLTGCVEWPQPHIRAAVWALTPRRGIRPSGFWYLSRPTFVCAARGAKQVVLCCGLKPAFGCIGSGASREGLQHRPRSAIACVQPKVTWQELESNPELVATCPGPAGVWERPRYNTSPAATSTGFGSVQQNGTGYLKACCPLSAYIVLTLCQALV